MIDTLVLDIETTNLSADLGVVLCVSYMSSRDEGEVVTLRNDVINPKDWKAGRRGNDRELVKRANEVIRNHDIIAAHYGMRFDLPFLRTRGMMQGLAVLPEKVVIDPWAVARRKFKFQRNRLDGIAKALGAPDRKTPLDLQVWRAAMLDGDKASMDLIVEHCEADVRVLAFVLDQVKPFVRQFNDRGSDV